MTNTHRTARYGHQRRTDSHPPSEVPEETIRTTLAQFGDKNDSGENVVEGLSLCSVERCKVNDDHPPEIHSIT